MHARGMRYRLLPATRPFRKRSSLGAPRAKRTYRPKQRLTKSRLTGEGRIGEQRLGSVEPFTGSLGHLTITSSECSLGCQCQPPALPSGDRDKNNRPETASLGVSTPTRIDEAHCFVASRSHQADDAK